MAITLQSVTIFGQVVGIRPTNSPISPSKSMAYPFNPTDPVSTTAAFDGNRASEVSIPPNDETIKTLDKSDMQISNDMANRDEDKIYDSKNSEKNENINDAEENGGKAGENEKDEDMGMNCEENRDEADVKILDIDESRKTDEDKDAAVEGIEKGESVNGKQTDPVDDQNQGRNKSASKPRQTTHKRSASKEPGSQRNRSGKRSCSFNKPGNRHQHSTSRSRRRSPCRRGRSKSPKKEEKVTKDHRKKSDREEKEPKRT